MEVDENLYYTIPELKNGIYKFRNAIHEAKRSGKKVDYTFFQHVYLNPITLLKMIQHSLTSEKEIIGRIYGHIDEKSHTYLLTDSTSYPCTGTDSRVEVTREAGISVWNRDQHLPKLGRIEDGVGWYHSHPNLHCFYSNTDVKQHIVFYTSMDGTAVGLVIDPINTMVSAHLNLGAYSITDPEEAKKKPPPSSAEVRKYGTAANEYYQLDIHYYCTDLDKAVLNDFITKSYGIALQSSPLRTSTEYLIGSIEKSKQSVDINEDRDPTDFRDQISSVNKDRQIGLWVHRKKRMVFG